MTMRRQGLYIKYSPDVNLNPNHGLMYTTTRTGKPTETGIKTGIPKTWRLRKSWIKSSK